MSDPKRATLITVGAPKSAKNNVKKTVRLAINLDESNENKYPELNYKELVIAEERKKKLENGKTGLDPFSDHDNDMQCVRIFEQKYGGNSTYGQKGRSKTDEFADMGAGYDENDSFIDNTEGYDEMMPPETDTLYGGFYINCGSLEFKGKEVPEGDGASDPDHGNRRNKRRISSSSSEEESSESSSESESAEEKDSKVIANGAVDSHKTEHRKKKNKKIEKKKAKKVRRTDSSAATSGKQTSDDNGQCEGEGEAESAESGTSQSDSLTSKPAPSSDNPVTSDSSRDGEVKSEVELPALVTHALEELEEVARKLLNENPNIQANDLLARTEQYIIRVSSALSGASGVASGGASAGARAAWARAAAALRVSREHLHRLHAATAPTTALTTAQPTTANTTANTSTAHKRKLHDDLEEDYSHLTDEQREAKIVEILQRLKTLIEECKPAMIAKYNAECERVHEERKKLSAVGGAVERRMPKRRFPWCGRVRALLGALVRLSQDQAGQMLQRRVLPLFPAGFVRMPTLLRQADLSKKMKVSDMKRQRAASTSQAPPTSFTEPIQFPSSLTVTTTVISSPNNADTPDDLKYKPDLFSTVLNSFKFNKDLIVEKPDKNDKDLYIPPNNIGSITITPVPNQKDKKNDKGFIRVKSPAALNEMVKKDKQKKVDKDKNHVKEKSLDTPLHVDTSYQTKEPGPKSSEIPQKQIENMRVAESNIPRPALIPVHHSPTFAKPDKRPPEVKKKKDVVIVSDVDPLADNGQEPLPADDSSSDVEVIEEIIDNSDKSEVPSKDKNVKKVPVVKSASDDRDKRVKTINDDIDIVMRNIREMEHSQEPPKFNSNSFGGVISNAKHEMSTGQGYPRAIFGHDTHKKDKFVEPAS